MSPGVNKRVNKALLSGTVAPKIKLYKQDCSGKGEKWIFLPILEYIRLMQNSYVCTKYKKNITEICLKCMSPGVNKPVNKALVWTKQTMTEQELLTLPEHLSSPPDFSVARVARSLVFCVVFCRSLLGLWSCFLLTIVLSVHLQFAASYYSFGIFKIFFRKTVIHHQMKCKCLLVISK
jgi:hypothetical protein